MRISLPFAWSLSITLAIAGTPALGAELQFNLMGEAFSPSVPNAQLGPVDVTFLLNTLSGTLQSSFFPPTDEAFDVAGAEFTDFRATFNGHTIFSAESITGGYDFKTQGGSSLQVFFGSPSQPSQLDLNFNPNIYITQAAFTASKDPMADVFLSFPPGHFGNQLSLISTTATGDMDVSFTDITVRQVSVTEPGVLELLLIGIAGVTASAVIRRIRCTQARIESVPITQVVTVDT